METIINFLRGVEEALHELGEFILAKKSRRMMAALVAYGFIVGTLLFGGFRFDSYGEIDYGTAAFASFSWLLCGVIVLYLFGRIPFTIWGKIIWPTTKTVGLQIYNLHQRTTHNIGGRFPRVIGEPTSCPLLLQMDVEAQPSSGSQLHQLLLTGPKRDMTQDEMVELAKIIWDDPGYESSDPNVRGQAEDRARRNFERELLGSVDVMHANLGPEFINAGYHSRQALERMRARVESALTISEQRVGHREEIERAASVALAGGDPHQRDHREFEPGFFTTPADGLAPGL